jgi:hypothetical protein
MAYKVVKYRLNSDGTIPTWLKFGVSQGTGGMYPVADNTFPSPRDYIMIGIADDGEAIPTDAKVGEIASKDDLITYLTSVSDGNNWKQFDSDDKEVDFVPSDAATTIWNDLTTLNS